MEGIITKQISNQYRINSHETEFICVPRGKFRHDKITPLVGDKVIFNPESKVIEEILPRRNFLDRPSVANVDIALIVTSLKKPDLDLILLDKELTIIKSKNIKPIICLTKKDLLTKNELKELKPIIKYYKSIGIDVIFNKDLRKLKRLLKGNIVVLTGQSGAGKSTLLNKLNKNLNLETNEISSALNRGVHTTRHTEIYFQNKIYFIDTPGFSAIDLKSLDKGTIKKTFNEFDKCICKYQDCYHIKENGCGVIPNVGKTILPSRYLNYQKFIREGNENVRKFSK